MNNEYTLLLPLAAEPAGGFTPGSQIDFLMNHPGKLLEKGCLRLTGLSTVTGTGDSQTIRFNSNAGAHSYLNHLIVMFNENNVEMNTEYARYVAANNETRKSCIELGTLSSEITELTGCDQDGAGDNLTNTFIQGQAVGTNANSMPFSILLNCCLNKSSSDIPLSRTGPIRLRMILKQPSDVFCGDDAVNVADVNYTLSNLCLRYVIKDDPGLKQPVMMERVQYAGQQTLQSTYNTFNTICPSSFNSCILLFKDSTHNNSATFAYDSILNENFVSGGKSVISNYVEWTLMGMDTPLTFPLRTQEEQIQNYILAHNKSLTKHGLNYAKLNNGSVPCGWGLGCWFGSDIPSMPVQCTINFTSNLDHYYNVYVFYKGSVVV